MHISITVHEKDLLVRPHPDGIGVFLETKDYLETVFFTRGTLPALKKVITQLESMEEKKDG